MEKSEGPKVAYIEARAAALKHFKKRFSLNVTRHRYRQLLSFSIRVFTGRKSERHLMPLAWAMVAMLIYALNRRVEFGDVFLPSIGLFSCLAAISILDARYYIIPDIWLVAIAILWIFTQVDPSPSELFNSFGAAICAFGGLKLVSILYERWRGMTGIGYGDIKLLGVCGLWVGFAGLPTLIMVTAISGLISTLILAAASETLNRNSAIAFGPHLCLGLWFVWIVGPFAL